MVRRDIINSLKRIIGHKDLIVLFVLALVIRLFFLMVMRSQVSDDKFLTLAPDTVGYVAWAKEVLTFRLPPGEASLIFGPGYGLFLAVIFLVFGIGPLPILIIQAILGSISCVLIFVLAKTLTDRQDVGLIAGAIAATSFTGVALANFILSDTLFFGLFLAGNLLFIMGLKSGRRVPLIWSGLFIGFAVLTRAAGQLWLFVMILLPLVYPLKETIQGVLVRKRDLMKRALMASLLAFLLIGAGIAKNYYYFQIPVVAYSGPFGVGRLTALTQAIVERCDINDVYARWVNQYRKDHGIENLSIHDAYTLYKEQARRTLHESPRAFIATYAMCVRDNILAGNELYLSQLPRSADTIRRWMEFLQKPYLRWYLVAMTMVGFALMIFRRQWAAAVFLIPLYLLFVVMVGFGMWQGSRLFYPAQIAWSIAVAFLIVEVWRFIRSALAGAGRLITRRKEKRPIMLTDRASQD